MSFNTKVQMLDTEVDMFRTDAEIGKHLKKSLNKSLFIPRGVSLMEQEKSLDSVLGDFKDLRGTFATTLKKHIEADG